MNSRTVCEAGCECYTEETQQATDDLSDGRVRVQNVVKRAGTYASVPAHGNKHAWY